jgi:protein-L-isoaspartate O-methyltransferase
VAQDSSNPDFWDTRYRGGVTPWDAAGVPPRLLTWLKQKRPRLRILVPGCGTGYEVRLFHELGHEVLAIDFSEAAIEAARRELGPLSHLVRKADLFQFDAPPFDVIYERALLCALPRPMWPQWAARIGELVRPEGELAGFFYLDDNVKGPPFGAAPGQTRDLLSTAFDLVQDVAVAPEQSIAVFKGKERWQVWRRRL